MTYSVGLGFRMTVPGPRVSDGCLMNLSGSPFWYDDLDLLSNYKAVHDLITLLKNDPDLTW